MIRIKLLTFGILFAACADKKNSEEIKSEEIIVTTPAADSVFIDTLDERIIYQKIITKSEPIPTGDVDYLHTPDQHAVYWQSTDNKPDKMLFITCLDSEGGTPIDYAMSEKFPFPALCQLEAAMLDKQNRRLYFQTAAWTVSPAVHYYNFADEKIYFFKDGWLESISSAGVEISRAILTEHNGRQIFTNFFDKDGNKIED